MGVGSFARVGLVLNPDKCIFFAQSIKYLGSILGGGSISSDPAKVEEILLAPSPTSKTEVRRFLGMCVFHRRMIPSYAELAHLISGLTKDDVRCGPNTWGDEHQVAFDAIKASIVWMTHLHLFD